MSEASQSFESRIQPQNLALDSGKLPKGQSRGVAIDPIANVDYIVDHYAILGVESSATEGEIKAAHRAKLLEWHPDRYASAPEVLKSQANRAIRLITEAIEILSDESKREGYDTLLKSFDPRLVSKDGTPIINLSARRVQVERLIAGESVDLEAKKTMASQLSGHSESIFNMIAQGFRSAPNDPDVRAAYRDALEKKLVYFTVLEDIGWEGAGVANQPTPRFVPDTESYLDARQAQVDSTREEIETLVDLKILQLSRGEAPLLLTAGAGQLSAADLEDRPVEIREDLLRVAKQSFESHIENVMKLAANRAQVIDELLTNFCEYRYLTPETDRPSDLLVILNQSGRLGQALHFKFNDAGADMTTVALPSLNSIEDLLKDVALNALVESFPDNAIILLSLNPELDILIQAGYVMKKHLERIS